MKAQKIVCTNHAGFVMYFSCETDTGATTGHTGSYPNPQSRTIDLKDCNLEEGAEVYPVVKAILGKKETGHPSIQYAENGEIAHYDVTGATWSFTVKLVG